ncbi:hypothetical protein ACFSLT_19820 [Novosphingobium resinovorum]
MRFDDGHFQRSEAPVVEIEVGGLAFDLLVDFFAKAWAEKRGAHFRRAAAAQAGIDEAGYSVLRNDKHVREGLAAVRGKIVLVGVPVGKLRDRGDDVHRPLSPAVVGCLA